MRKLLWADVSSTGGISLCTIWYLGKMLGLESSLDDQHLQVREIPWTIIAISIKRPIKQLHGPWTEQQTSKNPLFPSINWVSDPYSVSAAILSQWSNEKRPCRSLCQSMWSHRLALLALPSHRKSCPCLPMRGCWVIPGRGCGPPKVPRLLSATGMTPDWVTVSVLRSVGRDETSLSSKKSRW